VRIYHAGRDTQALYPFGMRRPLLSYADEGSPAFRFWVDAPPEGAEVFLDSGAHSVASRGTVIDLSAYCDYCLQHRTALETYVQLDVVGDQRQTRENLRVMEDRGLLPLPVFTAAADEGELDELCSRYRHIGLGGLKGREMYANEWRRDKLDRTFRIAERHWPVRFHCFGIISQWALERYPFYSADSASVILGGANGIMLRQRAGEYAWDHWTREVRRTGDAAIADPVPGNTSGSSRLARWDRSVQCIQQLERYATDLWAQRGVTFA
jgi:hypothetical protein